MQFEKMYIIANVIVYQIYTYKNEYKYFIYDFVLFTK